MSMFYVPEFLILGEGEIAEDTTATLPEPERPAERPDWVDSKMEARIIEATRELPYDIRRIWLRPPNEFENGTNPTFGLLAAGIFASEDELAQAELDLAKASDAIAKPLGPLALVYDERTLAAHADYLPFLAVTPNWEATTQIA